jgi:hypothetical protein
MVRCNATAIVYYNNLLKIVVRIDTAILKHNQKGAMLQCGKPFFSNTCQNGEWTETSTRQNEIQLAMFFGK